MFEDEENQSLKHIKTSTQQLGHTEHLGASPFVVCPTWANGIHAPYDRSHSPHRVCNCQLHIEHMAFCKVPNHAQGFQAALIGNTGDLGLTLSSLEASLGMIPWLGGSESFRTYSLKPSSQVSTGVPKAGML